MQIEYTYEEPEVRPVKSARFRATGGSRVIVSKVPDVFDGLRRHRGAVEIRLDFLTATFNKSDLAEFIEVLQKFHDQLP